MIEFIVALAIVGVVIFVGRFFVMAITRRNIKQQDFNDSAHWHEWAENQSRRDDL